MRAINLRVEYLKSPLGLGIKNPKIMWNCLEGKKQTAYQIIAKNNNEVVWDSSKVISSEMSCSYPNELKSRDHIDYEIWLWDETNEKGDGTSDYFEMSLLNKNDIKAIWVTGNYKVNKKKRYPVDCFKKEFNLENITKARLYITACGIYDTYINGRRVGDFYLAPGHTDYTKRIQLQTYDVTNLLKIGKNVIEVSLADGWYRGSCGAWGLKNQYGIETKLLAQLEVYNQDKIETIITDNTWSWSNDGPIRFADNKDGEIVDANLVPSYSKKAKVTSCNIVPQASNNVYITEHEEFSPTLIKTPSGKLVLDFKQNIAGIIAFKVKGNKGDKIVLKMGELIDKNGEFTQKNIQCSNKKGTKVTPLQQVIYTFKDGLNEYKTRFAIFGFQYVLVETNLNVNPADFKAIALYSNLEETLKFECSNKLINQFVKNTYWSAKNNHADIPTDCPTRERHGWTGDAQIFCNTASYLFNYQPMARKYLNDMVDGQRKNGCFRQITPKGGIDFYMNTMDGSPGWSDAGVLIPYRIYKQYGDLKILVDSYDAMKKYANYKIKTIGKHYLTGVSTGLKHKYAKMISNYGQSYGEWAEPYDVKPFMISDFVCPHPEETTAYLNYMLLTMEEIANILNKEEDAKIYKKYADIVKTGYQHLIETKKYSYDTDRQAKLVRPLYLNLLTPEQKEFAQKRLLKALDNYKWRLGTGFLSTPFILDVLEEIDLKYAYKLLLNEEMPGWLYMPKTGANTIWESWEGPNAKGGVASLNHYSKGAVCEWLFKKMAGINILGERNFLIEPKIGGNITNCSMTYQSIYGEVASIWKVVEDKVICDIKIPSNTKATIKINELIENVEAGDYHFEIKLK